MYLIGKNSNSTSMVLSATTKKQVLEEHGIILKTKVNTEEEIVLVDNTGMEFRTTLQEVYSTSKRREFVNKYKELILRNKCIAKAYTYYSTID